MKRLPALRYGWLSPLLILALWALVAPLFPAYLIPSPWRVAAEAAHMLATPAFYANLGSSLGRLAAGFSLAAALALALGLWCGRSAATRQFFNPLISFFQAVPPVAWAPMLIIFFGMGHAPMITVIAAAVLFPVWINTMDGARQIRLSHLRAAQSMGASGWRLIWHVYLPETLPAAVSGLRIGFGMGWRSLVAAEMIGASSGLGWDLFTHGQTGNMSAVFFEILAIGCLSVLLDQVLFRRVEARIAHWRAA